jgi:serine O-acetyltransferase
MSGVTTQAGARAAGPPFGSPRAGVLSTQRLLELRTRRVVGPFAHRLLRYVSGAEVPSAVQIGADLVLHHQAFGLVINENTRIGARVHLFHQVTIGVGKDRLWEPRPEKEYAPIVIEDDVWLCTGAIVLAGEDGLRIGRGTIVGAGAVLRDSTGPWEIWTGAPARCIGRRRPSIWIPPHARDPSREAVIWLDDSEGDEGGEDLSAGSSS